MRARDIPNIITVMRIIMVPPVIYLLLMGHFAAALLLFAVAGVSDAVDGFLAKHYNWSSRLGSILDPLADKLLLVSSYVSLAVVGLIPWWLAAVVVGRDIVIVGGAVAYHFRVDSYEMEPSIISKTNTFFQILLVLVIVFNEVVAVFPAPVISALVFLVLLTTVLSGYVYVSVWGRRARTVVKTKRAP